MKLYKAKYLAPALLCFFSVPQGHTEDSKSFVDSIKDGKTTLDFRFRVEDVRQEDLESDLEATATTLRTRLTFQTGRYEGFGGLIEFDSVTELDEVDYNAGPGRPVFPGSATILDPEGEDLNQAYISYANTSTTIKYGRQRILLDNQRFVGGVGWRQNEQTYDAFSINNTSVQKLNLFYAYIHNVNRIFGNDVAAGEQEMATHLLNAKYDFGTIGSLTGYKYLIDNESAPVFSTDTTGIRFTGKTGQFQYTMERAIQSDAGDNPVDYSASYGLLEGSLVLAPITLKAGYEVLGSDGTSGQFITPLATLHAFQGWGDIFLGGGSGNIPGGIEDMYASVGSKFGPVTTTVIYHQLSSRESLVLGASDLGSEIGVELAGKAGPVSLLMKFAEYNADEFGADTTKFWIMATSVF